VIAAGPLETGPDQLLGEISTPSGAASSNAPFFRRTGPDALSVASPAVEITLAVVDAVYSLPRPGVKAPKLAAAPSVSESVAGTVPPAEPSAYVAQPGASL